VRLALLAEAEAELEAAATWYDDRSEGLGDEFVAVAREAMMLVVEAPETWPVWPEAPPRIPPIRRFLMPRFPYALAYQGLGSSRSRMKLERERSSPNPPGIGLENAKLPSMRSAEAIAVEALSLPADERAALVLRLAESLDEQHDADAEDAWAAEVAGRIEALKAGTAETITTAEALAEARARLSARRG
jgi:putative addiction module component (TIGR02574 family)